jgi:hypothetical protein
MDMERNSLLKQLMAIDFYIEELNLYLDTHPRDQRAIQLINTAVANARILREEYERLCGPLTTFNTLNNGPEWRWIESPWPWEHM